MKTQIFIYGALGGFITSSVDEAIMIFTNHPIGSYLFIAGIAIYGYLEWKGQNGMKQQIKAEEKKQK